MRSVIYATITVALVLTICGIALAQPEFMGAPDGERERDRLREDIENLRVWKMTRYLELSTEKAQKFFPLYNEFRKQREKIEHEKRELFERIGKGAELSDYPEENLKKMLDKLESIERKFVDLRAEFRNKVQEVLSVHQTAKLTVFEHRFQREIQEMIREARRKNPMRDRFRDRR